VRQTRNVTYEKLDCVKIFLELFPGEIERSQKSCPDACVKRARAAKVMDECSLTTE
jgi:hypothetical protein